LERLADGGVFKSVHVCRSEGRLNELLGQNWAFQAKASGWPTAACSKLCTSAEAKGV